MHVQHAIAASGKFGVVRDQYKGRAAPAMAAEQQLDDLASRCLVEISGRLVGDYNGGIGRERAGHRDALLLAAGKFSRIMMQPLGKSDRFQLASGSIKRILLSSEFERHGNVFQRRHGWDQVEGLKHDPHMRAAKARKTVLVELAQILPVNDDGARVWPLQPGHDHEQRRFTRAGWSKQRHGFASAYIQADVAQDMDTSGAAAERQVDAA